MSSLGDSAPRITALVEAHYDRAPYPDPCALMSPVDPGASTAMLEWDVGWATSRRFPPSPHIWVAGCGTVQATEIACRYPQAHVLATDLSESTLETARAIAEAADVADRIAFVRHDLSTPPPTGQRFDLIDCMGVLHHLPAPGLGLDTLAAALAPHGVLDLMVYQDAHRRVYRQLRRALLLLGAFDAPEGPEELAWALVRDLHGSEHAGPSVRDALADVVADGPERPSAFADAVLHPHELATTPADFVALAADSGLAFAGFAFPHLWEPSIYLDDPALADRLRALEPVKRAEVLSLLVQERAPYLDLYLAPRGCEPPSQPSDAALLSGAVRPVGPWRRQVLEGTAVVSDEPWDSASRLGDALVVRGPRGVAHVGSDGVQLLEIVGGGCSTRHALQRWAEHAGVGAEEHARPFLDFLRRVLGPAARLLLYEPEAPADGAA